MSARILDIDNVARRFGGIQAVAGVSLDVEAHEIHALIGPNGAGKSTLVNLIGGVLAPDSGSIRLDGRAIQQLSMARRTRLGLGRSFQISSLFDAMSVADNLRVAAIAETRRGYRFWQPAARDDEIEAAIDQAMMRFGLADVADRMAGSLAHGQKRSLELALACHGRPRILILDEPLAGTGPEESAMLVTMIAELRNQAAILLIEHDMDAVFSLADRITVMVNGHVIKTGSPDAVRNDAGVREAYLGSG
jgi:branched-chain amino acid transport system ATP-binding protein